MADLILAERPLSYKDFILSKSHSGGDHGFKPISLPPVLFDFQAAMVEWALHKGRAALFEDCGLGKTVQELVWADNVVRKTNGRVLFCAPLAAWRPCNGWLSKWAVTSRCVARYVGRPINCARGWWSLSGTKGWPHESRA